RPLAFFLQEVHPDDSKELLKTLGSGRHVFFTAEHISLGDFREGEKIEALNLFITTEEHGGLKISVFRDSVSNTSVALYGTHPSASVAALPALYRPSATMTAQKVREEISNR